jgi:light-harvesting complex I chlorophyll a/b binding protein 1
MLAALGFVTTDFYRFTPFEDLTTLNAFDACLQNGVIKQMVSGIGLLEVFSIIALSQMNEGSGREPGNYGLAPSYGLLKFNSRVGKNFRNMTDAEKFMDLKTMEITHGRAAMIGFSGMVTQAVLTGNVFPYLANP